MKNQTELTEAKTELKETKKELKQANIDIDELKEYQLFVNTVKEYAILFLDVKGHITRWGPGAERLYLHKTNDVMGKHFSFLYCDEDIEQEWPSHNLNQASEKDIYEEVREQLRRDKTHFWANIVMAPLRDEENDTLIGFAKIVKDISEQKAWDEQLKQNHKKLATTIQELNESNRDLELFATIAAHDLQEPLRKVECFTEMVEKESATRLGKESLDYLRRAKASMQNMQALISNLLQLAKVSQEHLNLRPVSLSSIVTQTLKILEKPIHDKKAEIRVGHLDDLNGDEGQLIQLLQNLIDNALKFQHIDKKTIINISSKKIHEQYCEIQVQDNGIGFEQEHANLIFETFQRLVGKSSYPGSGVGLALCKRIIERHYGNIAVKSKPDKGTTFIITLPLHGLTETLTHLYPPDAY